MYLSQLINKNDYAAQGGAQVIACDGVKKGVEIAGRARQTHSSSPFRPLQANGAIDKLFACLDCVIASQMHDLLNIKEDG
ncbi:hypothetical protein [Mixta calida]|uniref:Uncharacterized protein n=1 Tax=Mixta calida TaxID=665913 RepID=A0ABM6RX60_9GAMM|nr:hypothetical protein [Mixta calida]AUY24079.1 hypothetical protein C2E16_03570 [Mixta calida]KAF0858217.1 hypothetical protein Y888_17720 [Mixta calida B021323]MDU5768971.1 hypothetical protein [Mixta calida]MDU5828670.1 hypothetical protein [Mixta calida]MDU6413900.1 hypothetical protein [Mixta calida]